MNNYWIAKWSDDPKVLHKVVLDEPTNTGLLAMVVRNTSTRPETLEVIATNLYRNSDEVRDEVRNALASNPRTPVGWLAKLSLQNSTECMERLVGNPSTPENILGYLWRYLQQDADTAEAFSENPNTPSQILEQILSEPLERAIYPETLRCVLEHPNCPDYLRVAHKAKHGLL